MTQHTASRITRTALAALTLAVAPLAAATEVVLRTDLGPIRIDLFEEEAPQTVANFLAYLESGAFEDSIIHRSVRRQGGQGFVIQGGAYRIEDGLVRDIETGDPVPNEPGISNTRGTIAMAKIEGDPDSATSQWFINLGDNSELDTNNGGFTVFGQVVGDGMAVADAINALPIYNLGEAGFSETPLRNFQPGPGARVQLENFVSLNAVELSSFTINEGLNDAWFEQATSGQGMFINVWPEIGRIYLSWFTFDLERPADDVPSGFGEPGHRWITALGPISGDTATLQATLTSGGVFDAEQPDPVNEPYGTMTVTFSDCNNAVVTYDFPGPGVSGEIPITRVVNDNVALCEMLWELGPATD